MTDTDCPVCLAKRHLKVPTAGTDVIGEFVNNYVEALLTIVESSSTDPNQIIKLRRMYCEDHSSPKNPMEEFRKITLGKYCLYRATCCGCIRAPTNTYCFKCKGFLCSECLGIHRKELMNDHSPQVDRWDKICDFTLERCCESEINNECQDHERGTRILVRKTSFKACCKMCLITTVEGTHEDHHLSDVAEAVKKSKENMKKRLKQVEKKIEAIDEAIERHFEEKTDIQCENHDEEKCLFFCEKCKKYLCIKCVEGGLDHPLFLHRLKLPDNKGSEPFNKKGEKIMKRTYRRSMEERRESVLQKWNEFTEVLRKQADESTDNLLHLRWYITILRCLLETSSWTYVQYQSRIKQCLVEISRIGTNKCNKRKCTTCDKINTRGIVTGPIGCQEILGRFDCQSQNVVYVMTCEDCGLLYVGQTGQTLDQRMRKHDTGTQPVDKHFNEPSNPCNNYSVAAVFHVQDADERENVETALMLKLGTLCETVKVVKTLPVSPLFKGMNKKRTVTKEKFKLEITDKYFKLAKGWFVQE